MANNSLEKTYEIEKMLKRDARQQKSIGSGVFHRASRRGYIKGGIKTPYDYMSAKERKKLNGEVKTYMIYEQGIEYVKTLDEIMEMSYDERLTYFTNIMKHYKVRDLCSKWKISTSTLYNNYIPKIGYVKNTEAALKKAGRKKKNQNISTQVENADNLNLISEDNANSISMEKEKKEKLESNINMNKLVENNSNIHFGQEFTLKGRYTLSNIDNIYSKIKILLDQDLFYDIEINAKEAHS